MKVNLATFTNFLDELANELDIPPSKYHEAVDRYLAVGRWLEQGRLLGSTVLPRIYPQGSFRLGTVVRPIRRGIPSDFDIDLVCELLIRKLLTDPRSVKKAIGHRLRENEKYRQMLDQEGKRCWTLIYAEADRIGFHLDVLPSVFDPSTASNTAIAITNKEDNIYTWSVSDPNGYANWFEAKNRQAFKIFWAKQKDEIRSRFAHIYASVNDVPDQLVRTPLQRAIQILKRHRDVYFDKPETHKFAPISMIITTLAAELYASDRDVYAALRNIVVRLHAYTELLSVPSQFAKIATPNLIERSPEGLWRILNPVNPEENFADRWHEDGHKRAEAFFSWVDALKRDLIDQLDFDSSEILNTRIKTALAITTASLNLGSVAASQNQIADPPTVNISSRVKPWGND